MYCSKCGTKNNDDANFCWNCGAPLAKKAIESYTQAVELALAGDEKGFSYLYEETYKSKYYLALKYMDDKDAAEDVLQDSYIKAFSKLASLKEPETFPSWLGTIVANTAKNALQKKNPVLFTDLPSGEEDSDLPDFEIEDESVESQPEAAYTKQETEELVHELIDSLSDEQKMCILMYYIDGESVRDIAESLDCTESAVKSRLSYGRKNLKAKVEEMQKKGYKLFTLAPIPLLLALVHKDAEAAVCEKEFLAAGRRVAEEVLQKATQIAKTAAASQAGGTGAAAHQAGTGTVAKAAAGAGTAGKGGVGVGAAAGFISTTAGKVVIFVVAVAVVTVAVVGGMHSRYVRRSEEVVVYEDGSVPEEPEQSGSDDTGNNPTSFDDASESETDAANDTAVANAPSVMSVQGLLELFPYMADNLLYEYYGGFGTGYDLLKDGITSTDQVYLLAALAVGQSSEFFLYDDGQEQEIIDGNYYWILPTELYEKYLRDMFGAEYDISDFIETPGQAIRDSGGSICVLAGEVGYEDIEVTIEDISDAPEADGTYSALAKYSESDPENGNALGEYYMLYRLKPDESSDYGCVIVDMLPAGSGEIDEDFLSQMNTNTQSELSQSDVENLLNMFQMHWNNSDNEAIEYKEIDAGEVYSEAAWAITKDYPGVIRDDGFDQDGFYYACLSKDIYESYIQDMFGSEYNLDGFVWGGVDDRQIVIEDQDGNFYIALGDGEASEVKSIEKIIYDPNAYGTYAVLAKYGFEYYDTGGISYRLFWVKPDQNAAFGCVVTGMTDAYSDGNEEPLIKYIDSLESDSIN